MHTWLCSVGDDWRFTDIVAVSEGIVLQEVHCVQEGYHSVSVYMYIGLCDVSVDSCDTCVWNCRRSPCVLQTIETEFFLVYNITILFWLL